MVAVTTSYPGVYVTEVPSGVRTISGAATSVTAFVGRTWRGPIGKPTTVNSLAEYERTFGGLWQGSTISYAVRDYFANGGGTAVVVRLADSTAHAATFARSVKPPPDPPQNPPTDPPGVTTVVTGLDFAAASPGTWADKLVIAISTSTFGTGDVPLGMNTNDLFNLTVSDPVTGVREVFRNVTTVDGPRRVDRVVAAESRLVAVTSLPRTTVTTTGTDGKTTQTETVHTPTATTTTDAYRPTAGSDGAVLTAAAYAGTDGTGLSALDHTAFNLLCLPPPTIDGVLPETVFQDARTYCYDRRAVLIVDPPPLTKAADVRAWLDDKLKINGESARNAVLYYPRVRQADPNAQGRPATFAACGVLAGLIARTDATRGVWKAPAGTDATLNGVVDLETPLTDAQTGTLNSLGVNCLRTFPVIGTVAWGARTLRGADQLGDEYRYLPVRRLALYLEESLFRGTQWAVFEPNDERLWSQLRLNVGAFLHNLFRQGAFAGTTSRDAYFVTCDSSTTTPYDVGGGVVNVRVGFAPLRPAEFVVLQIQQISQITA